MLYAYESPVSDSLYVVARAQTLSEKVSIAAYATHRDGSGRQSQASDYYGPSDLGADSNANVLMIFPTAKLGGVVSVSMFPEDFKNEGVAELQTR